jgi:hypothetical protein
MTKVLIFPPRGERQERQLSLPGGFGSGRCSVCGRLLTNPKSVERGVGPVCAGRCALNDNDGDDRPDQFLPIPLEKGIVLKRDRGYACTNIPRLVTHHSPDGYEWGYGGSGPADLALNIAEMILIRIGYSGPRQKMWRGECYEIADIIHQELKWEFIAAAPYDGGTIHIAQVERWVRGRLAQMQTATP